MYIYIIICIYIYIIIYIYLFICLCQITHIAVDAPTVSSQKLLLEYLSQMKYNT